MSRRLKMLLLITAVFCIGLSAVGVAEVAKGKAVAGFPLILEVEDFNLQNGKIVEHKDASNGKAVIATDHQFEATKTITFKATGLYELTVFENAPDANSDGINVKASNGNPTRTYVELADTGKFAPCVKKLAFVVMEPGEELTITIFTTNEFGALYDKVLIEYVKAI